MRVDQIDRTLFVTLECGYVPAILPAVTLVAIGNSSQVVPFHVIGLV